MIPLQPILIVFTLGIGLLYVFALRSRLISRMFVLGFVSAGLVFVVEPELTNRLAHWLGVGRGADLLLYLFSMAVCYGFLAMYVKLRTVEQKLTKLVRFLAVSQARGPEVSGTRDASGDK